MNAELWARVETIFAEALRLPAAQRPRYLADACGDDAGLRAEVDSLLAAHASTPGPLDEPAPWLAAAEDDATDDVESLGPYRIVRLLGRGGMGRVYLARREAPDFQQLVAIKLIRRGLDTEDLLHRFRTERQILARLNHPNIAHLLDVGATATGTPFFVMEYVDGVPILEYCDRAGLPIADRLRLFMTVCAAVQHAHRNLIVHRDLKPGNILVTSDGVPKLLDFGIAKIVDPSHGDDAEQLTRTGLRMLTPDYCAPEQIRGDPITTASDVYALGLLLYELLAGRHAYGRERPGRTELERWVLERDPVPPSAAVTEGWEGRDPTATRGLPAPQLRRLLRGDLDTVVLEALRKEPEERYSSALALAEDIGRYLEGRPVRARPATLRYRARKFIARNPLGTSAAAAFVVLLAGATALTAYQSSRIRQESVRVTRERDKALEVRSFLLETFGATGPDQATGDTVTARQLLDRRAATLAEAYPDDEEMRAEMTYVLAEGYEKLGLLEQAERLGREALDARRRLFGADHADVATSLNLVGWVLRERGDLAGAETLLDEAVAIGRRVFPADGDARLARALNDLGTVRHSRGAYQDAIALYGESIDMRRRLLGEEHLGVAIALSNLGLAQYHLGDFDSAIRTNEEALALLRSIVGPDHQRTMIAETNLAALHTVRGDHESAARLHRDLLERRRRQFGPRHASVAVSATMLANALVSLGGNEEAERLLEEAVAIQREASGVRREDLAATLRVLGGVQTRLGRHEAALARFAEGLEIMRVLVGDTHEEIATLLVYSAAARDQLGQSARADADFREATRVADASLGDTHRSTLTMRLMHVEFLIRQRRHAEAGAALDAVDRALEQAGLSTDDPLRERARRARASSSR